MVVSRTVELIPHDLVVMGFNEQEDISLAEAILESGEHHLLLVPRPQQAPSKALVCVTSGEPGKDDVLFAGRLIRHLSADATLLSVVPSDGGDKNLGVRTERFLPGGVESLSLLGVPARANVRSGTIADEICREAKEGGYDLLVLGSPLFDPGGRISFHGVVEQILKRVNDRAVLVVRSH